MRYIPPYGSENLNAGYVTGSRLSGEVLEHPQREIIHVITAEQITPDNNHLNQLNQAIDKKIQRSLQHNKDHYKNKVTDQLAKNDQNYVQQKIQAMQQAMVSALENLNQLVDQQILQANNELKQAFTLDNLVDLSKIITNIRLGAPIRPYHLWFNTAMHRTHNGYITDYVYRTVPSLTWRSNYHTMRPLQRQINNQWLTTSFL